MEVYEVELTGIAPIKFNQPTADAIKGLNPGTKSQKREDATGREAEAMDRVHWTWGLAEDSEDPVQYVGASRRMIKKAVLDGASMGNVKIGRKSAIGYLKATVMVTDGSFGVTAPDKIVEDVVRIPPRTGALVLKAWPLLETGWRLTFQMTLLQPAILGPSVARAALDAGGLLAGMGTERPEYGRFTVTKWQLA